MRADGLGDAAVAAFKNSYEALCSGATGMIPEAELTPAASVPSLDAMADPGAEEHAPDERRRLGQRAVMDREPRGDTARVA